MSNRIQVAIDRTKEMIEDKVASGQTSQDADFGLQVLTGIVFGAATLPVSSQAG